MAVAYVDSSVIVAMALRQPGRSAIERALARSSHAVTAEFTEAEVASALRRVELPHDPEPWMHAIRILHATRSLRREIRAVLNRRYLRGADCWHLATALWFQTTRGVALEFVTMDKTQGDAARALGLRVA